MSRHPVCCGREAGGVKFLADMPHGHIRRVEPGLGFGWIMDDAGMDWFFVRDGVRGGAIERLAPNDRVVFDFETTPRGPRAADIALEFPQEVE
jgi:cold shock CspA family protein